jgi:hypothetical protein
METLGTGVGKLDIKFQIGSVRTITFAFINVDISAWTFEFYLKRFIGDRVKTLSLTLGSGLSIPIYSESVLSSFTALNTNIEEGEYYWELRRMDINVPLLSGNAYFSFDSQIGSEIASGVSITNTTIQITITNGGVGSVIGALVICGYCDLSTNLFPTTGGTGLSGAAMKGNCFVNLFASTTILGADGGIIPKGAIIMAIVNNPGQTSANWIQILSVA